MFSSFLITDYRWIKDDFIEPKSVIGVVETDVNIDGTRKIYLKDLSFNGLKANGKMLIYVNGSENTFNSGTLVRFVCNVKPIELVSGYSVNGWAFRDNIRYSSTVSFSDLKVIGKKNSSVNIKIREFIYQKTVKGLGQRSGHLPTE